MRIASLGIILIVLCAGCKSQELAPKQLLDLVNSAASKIENGYYKLHNNYYRSVNGEDTVFKKSITQCRFRKNAVERSVGLQLYSKRDDKYQQLFDGRNYYSLTPWNQTLEVSSVITSPEKLNDLKSNYTIYPFFKYINDGLQYYNTDSMIGRVVVTGEEIFRGEKCYKVETLTRKGKNKMKSRQYYYISAKTFLPVRHYVTFEDSTGKAREVQVFDVWIDEIKFDIPSSDGFLKSSLGNYNREVSADLPEDKPASLLAIGTEAPDWELPLLDGTKLKLSSLLGKIVIMDFWYKSCLPCQKQMTSLQVLHEKYKDCPVVFIGINTKDDPTRDNLSAFLTNRGITMLSVYQGLKIEAGYHVTASPALFVIDKTGKIVYNLDGYSDKLIEDLKKVIDKLI
jgi:peroxiredoxin